MIMKSKQILRAYHVNNVFYSCKVPTKAGQMKGCLKWNVAILSKIWTKHKTVNCGKRNQNTVTSK